MLMTYRGGSRQYGVAHGGMRAGLVGVVRGRSQHARARRGQLGHARAVRSPTPRRRVIVNVPHADRYRDHETLETSQESVDF